MGCDAEEGERNLKALPYVISWFEMVKEVAAADGEEDSYTGDDDDEDAELEQLLNVIEQRKLDAILQFAKAMPLLFGGIATINMYDSGKSCNKRKRIKG